MANVSVIIPTYNRPKLVVRALKSVLDQTYSDFEVIIVDDSRNNETEKFFKDVTDPRVRYYHNSDQLGYSENRNRGVLLTEPITSFVAFLDDDDEYKPAFLQKTIYAMEGDDALMALSTRVELRRHDGSFVCYVSGGGDGPFWQVAMGNGWLLRKDIFTKFNIWFNKDMLDESLDFGFRVARDHKYGMIPDALKVYYRYPDKLKNENTHPSLSKNVPQENFDIFFKREESMYYAAGDKAFAWLCVFIGKNLMRTGHYTRGRYYFRMAIKRSFTVSNIGLYFIAFLVPSAYSSTAIMILKNKILSFLKSRY